MCTIANPQPFSAHGYYNKIYSIFMEKIQEKKKYTHDTKIKRKSIGHIKLYQYEAPIFTR